MAGKTQIANMNVLLTADTGRFTRGMKRAGMQSQMMARKVSGAIGRVKGAMMGLAAFALGGFGIYAFFNEMQRLDELAKTARRINITTEELSALQFAFEQTGTDAAQASRGIQNFMRQISDAAAGTGEAVDALESLGLDARDLNQMDIVDQLRAMADAMQGVENANDRMSIAMDLFGGRNRTMVNLLMEGSDALDAYIAEAERLGLVVGGEAAANAESFNDAMNRLKSALRGLAVLLADKVVPMLTVVVDKVTNWVASLRTGEGAQARMNLKWAAMVAGFVAGISVFARVVRAIGGIITALKAMTAAQTTALALSGPAGWAILATGAVVAAGAVAASAIAFDRMSASIDEAVAEMEGVADEAQAIADGTDAMNEGMEEFTERMAMLEARAAAVFESTRSEAERTAEKLEELNELFELGFIDENTYRRAVDQLHGIGDAGVDAANRIGDAMEDMQRRAATIIDSLRTDTERVQDDIAEVLQLAALGFLTPDQADEAIRRLREQSNANVAMPDTGPTSLSPSRVNLAAMGASTAVGRDARDALSVARDQLEEQRLSTDVLEGIYESVRAGDTNNAIAVIGF